MCVQAEKLKVAQPFFDRTWAKFQEALDQLPEEDKGKKLKPVQVHPMPRAWSAVYQALQISIMRNSPLPYVAHLPWEAGRIAVQRHRRFAV